MWVCGSLGGGDRAGVEAQIRESGRRVTVVRAAAVAQVLQVHEPLGPESPTDALAVHGQVDQLACEGRRETFHKPSTVVWVKQTKIKTEKYYQTEYFHTFN